MAITSATANVVQPKHKDLEHGSTVVVSTKKIELVRILHWCTLQGKSVPKHMLEVMAFPYCVSVSGANVGWTAGMSRALYYMAFSEFLTKSGQ